MSKKENLLNRVDKYCTMDSSKSSLRQIEEYVSLLQKGMNNLRELDDEYIIMKLGYIKTHIDNLILLSKRTISIEKNKSKLDDEMHNDKTYKENVGQ